MSQRRRNNNRTNVQTPRQGRRQPRPRHHKRRRKDKIRKFINEKEFDSRHYSTPNPLESPTTSNSNAIIVKIQSNAFEGIATAFVNLYLARGGLQFSPSDDFAFLARVYITETLATIANGGTPMLTKAPRILGILANLLTRRRYPKGNGWVVVNFDVTGSVNVNEVVQSGPNGAIGRMNYGVKSSTQVLNGNIPKSDSPGAYTEERGLEAVQSAFDYLENNINSPLLKQEEFPLSEDKYSEDMSAFGFTTKVLGGGLNNVGGQFKIVASEAPIRFPMFATFVENTLVDLARTGMYNCPWMGDANSSMSTILTMYQEPQLTSKRKPNIKYYDFNEIVDTVSRWVCKIQEMAMRNEDYRTQSTNNSNYFIDSLQNPLTFQEEKIMLRSVAMNITGDGQLAGCTVYPTNDAGNSNTFRPLLCGNGQGPYAMEDYPLLPQGIVEMLEAMRGKVMDPPQWERSPKPFLSVLGVYDKDVLSSSDYVAEGVFRDEVQTFPCFAEDVNEIQIDMVDGTAGGDIFFINDAYAVTDYIVRWNAWVKRIASFSVALAPAGNGGGIAALSTPGLTHHVLDTDERKVKKEVVDYVPEGVQLTAKKRKAYMESMGTRRNNRKLGEIENFYDSRSIIDTSSFDVPFAPVQQNISSCYITPVNKLTRNTTEGDNNSIQSMKTINEEMISITSAQGFARFASLGEKHDTMAERCVRSEHAPISADEQLYEQATRDGDGGIGGDIFKAIGHTAVGVGTELAKIGVDRLGDMIPV